jgi:hypothetical protein
MTRLDRIIELRKIRFLGADYSFEIVMGRIGIMGYSPVADGAVFLPASQGFEVVLPVDQVVDLHKVYRLAAHLRH